MRQKMTTPKSLLQLMKSCDSGKFLIVSAFDGNIYYAFLWDFLRQKFNGMNTECAALMQNFE